MWSLGSSIPTLLKPSNKWERAECRQNTFRDTRASCRQQETARGVKQTVFFRTHVYTTRTDTLTLKYSNTCFLQRCIRFICPCSNHSLATVVFLQKSNPKQTNNTKTIGVNLLQMNITSYQETATRDINLVDQSHRPTLRNQKRYVCIN